MRLFCFVFFGRMSCANVFCKRKQSLRTVARSFDACTSLFVSAWGILENNPGGGILFALRRSSSAVCGTLANYTLR